MKKKCLMMLLCALICIWGVPLKVNAETSAQPPKTTTPPIEDAGDLFEYASEYGFANDMMIAMTAIEGIEGETPSIEYFSKMQVMSAELEAGKFYTISLDFIYEIKPSNLERFDDVNLQIRFPAVLLSGSPNAIGFAVNGSTISTWSDTFGIRTTEDIDLYYVEDSGEIWSMAEISKLNSDGIDILFASDSGLPMGGLLKSSQVGSADSSASQLGYCRVKFVIYTAPHEGKVSCEDIALNYWAAQDLMYDSKTTPAPESYYFKVALDENGAVVFPESSASTKDKITAWVENLTIEDTIICVMLILAIMGICIWLILRHRARKRGYKSSMDLFLDSLRLSDDDDEKKDDNDTDSADNSDISKY